MRPTIIPLLLLLSGVACADTGGPDTTDAAFCGKPAPAATPLPTTPDFVASVARITFESGWVPAGFYLCQYAVWINITPATTPNAGVILSESTPVFVRRQDGTVEQVSSAAVSVGDVVQVWHRPGAAYGAVQAPPSSPAYFGSQIVILE